jgi:hypothetical protein
MLSMNCKHLANNLRGNWDHRIRGDAAVLCAAEGAVSTCKAQLIRGIRVFESILSWQGAQPTILRAPHASRGCLGGAFPLNP